jgi:hypothetical protein
MTSVSDVKALNAEQLTNISISNSALDATLGAATSSLTTYLYPCVGYDNLIIDRIDQINIKKNQIVSLLTSNYDKLITNCGIATKSNGTPGVSSGYFVSAGFATVRLDACLLESNIISVASSVVVSGTLTTFNYNCQTFIDNSLGVGLGTTAQCNVGIKGEVRRETLYSFVRPYLETMYISANDWTGIKPTDGAVLELGGGPVGIYTYVGIGTTTPRNDLGIGLSVSQFTDVFDPRSVHKNQSELIGYYYPINDPLGCGVTIMTVVQTLENEILTIRAGISTLITVTNGARTLKVESQSDKWWIMKTQSKKSAAASNINSFNDNLDSIPF